MQSVITKGDRYEAYVLGVIKSEIERGALPFPVDHTVVTPKKTFKALSGNLVEVDIAIEVFRNRSRKPFLIILVECKDYSGPVDTLRLADLHTKMSLIRAHKGIVFTTSDCNSGVIREAEFLNISIARLNYGDTHPTYIIE